MAERMVVRFRKEGNIYTFAILEQPLAWFAGHDYGRRWFEVDVKAIAGVYFVYPGRIGDNYGIWVRALRLAAERYEVLSPEVFRYMMLGEPHEWQVRAVRRAVTVLVNLTRAKGYDFVIKC